MRILLSILSTLLIPSSLYAQKVSILDTATLKCQYSYLYQTDSLNQDSKLTDEMVLLIGKQQSVFTSSSLYTLDSLLLLKDQKKIEMSAFLKAFQELQYRIRYHIYKQQTSDSVHYIHWSTNSFSLKERAKLEWKLGGQTKEIKGYQCKNAFTSYAGRDYEAWYTSEIPISEGPYKFSGLPGLILSIQDHTQTHRFDIVGIEKTTSPIYYTKRHYLTVTKKQLAKSLKTIRLKSIEKTKEWFAHDPDKIQRIRERKKNWNNSIELIDH